MTRSWDPFLQQENDVNNELFQREKIEAEQSDGIQSSDTPHSFSGYAATLTQISTVLTDEDLSQKIRSLNLKQRRVFGFVYNREKSYIISKSVSGKQVPVPFHLFLSGDGGCEQSHLIKTIFHSVSYFYIKTEVQISQELYRCCSININGTTIHSGNTDILK